MLVSSITSPFSSNGLSHILSSVTTNDHTYILETKQAKNLPRGTRRFIEYAKQRGFLETAVTLNKPLHLIVEPIFNEPKITQLVLDYLEQIVLCDEVGGTRIKAATLPKKGEVWSNWGKINTCEAEIKFPNTKKKLIDLVKNTAFQKRKIRVVGSGHSGNDIACCNDLLINLKNLEKIISVNSALKQVKFEAGITIEDFNVRLATYGLALSHLISITQPTFSGAIATPSHGTGHTGSLSSFVSEIELVTADGKLLQLSPNNDLDAFKAACTSLGTLGVIYSIAVQCEPLFKLNYRNVNIPTDELLLKYKEFYDTNDYVQFRWNTKINSISIDCWNRVSIDTPLSKSVKYSFEMLPCDKGLPYITEVKTVRESLEMAIPEQVFSEAIQELNELILRWKSQKFEIPNFNIRFVKADTNTFLSPAGCDVIFFGMNPATSGCYEEFERIFLTKFRARPHWGKKHSLDYKKTLFLYGDNFLKFIAVKRRLDPNNVFSNAYTNRILYP